MLTGERAPRLIDLRSAIASPVGRTLFRLVENPIEKMLSVPKINRLYARSLEVHDQRNYFSAVLRVLDVEYELSDEDRAKIPAQGPVVIVANHPFGAIEGVVLGDILSAARADARLLGNHLLASVPEVRPWVFPVDPWGGSEAVRANVASVKACVRWVERGGCLGVFPAGTVAHLRVTEASVKDPPWNANVAALVRRTGATVVPVFFEGRNSAVFQLAGLIHPMLRTALLPSELLKRSNSRVGVRIGRPIGPEKIGRYQDDETLIDYLRWKTYMLKRRESPIRPRFQPRAAVATPEPLQDAVPGALLASEVGRLSADARLHEHGDLQLFVARARQIPAVLREIGRLREKTFREVSEGTGRSCDLDRFDDSYLHLFMWNRATHEVVGSYRLGLVDEILARDGVPGLYTSTLFKFKAEFLERLGPSVELGRSFIRAEYQRKPTSLALLWRGIGEFLVRNPRYKVLFGPVSISRDYKDLSRHLMVELLGRQRGDETFAPMVRAKNPLRGRRLPRDERRMLRALVRDIDDVSNVVSEVEEDDKGMPVLLRHYLRLGGKLLGFNVDPEFGDCLDGLIVVDLRATEAKILKRFMGEDGYAFYASVA